MLPALGPVGLVAELAAAVVGIFVPALGLAGSALVLVYFEFFFNLF